MWLSRDSLQNIPETWFTHWLFGSFRMLGESVSPWMNDCDS